MTTTQALARLTAVLRFVSCDDELEVAFESTPAILEISDETSLDDLRWELRQEFGRVPEVGPHTRVGDLAAALAARRGGRTRSKSHAAV